MMIPQNRSRSMMLFNSFRLYITVSSDISVGLFRHSERPIGHADGTLMPRICVLHGALDGERKTTLTPEALKNRV